MPYKRTVLMLEDHRQDLITDVNELRRLAKYYHGERPSLPLGFNPNSTKFVDRYCSQEEINRYRYENGKLRDLAMQHFKESQKEWDEEEVRIGEIENIRLQNQVLKNSHEPTSFAELSLLSQKGTEKLLNKIPVNNKIISVYELADSGITYPTNGKVITVYPTQRGKRRKLLEVLWAYRKIVVAGTQNSNSPQSVLELEGLESLKHVGKLSRELKRIHTELQENSEHSKYLYLKLENMGSRGGVTSNTTCQIFCLR